ncbi:hypothetical protein ACFY00_21435 [Kitasatospora sp. NPDC001540]|uniref:hypothetical protein n=1 Tax=Kitasatospora sp. NPDC001540 TaxID=3364014 RepID=UPI00369D77B1
MDPDLDLELSAMMETSVKDLCVPVAVIVAESGRRGRRRKLARQLRIAGATLAVAAVAFAGANAGLPLVEAGPRTGTEVGPAAPAGPPATAPRTPAPTLSVDPSPSPSASASATGTAGRRKGKQLPLAPVPVLGTPRAEVTANPSAFSAQFVEPAVFDDLRVMLAERQGKLAPGPSFHVERGDNASAVYLSYGDGTEPGSMELRLGRTELPFPADGSDPGPGEAPFRCGEDSGTAGNHSTACFGGYLPDGRWELIETDDSRIPGLHSYRVALWYPNGTVLDFTEYAGLVTDVDRPTAHVHAEPPLDLTVWRSVTESPVWTYYTPARGGPAD